jgi:hypothetical protein
VSGLPLGVLGADAPAAARLEALGCFSNRHLF